MISPIILYTNLFTLYGCNEKTNKYIDMYYVWLLYIIKYAKLNDSDYCITLIDNVTFSYIKRIQYLLFYQKSSQTLK